MTIKDHQKSRLLNALRDCANIYANTGQLRAQLAIILDLQLEIISEEVHKFKQLEVKYNEQAIQNTTSS